MSLEKAKVIDYLGQYTDKKGVVWDKVVIKLPPQEEWDGNPDEEKVIIAHDYVRFSGGVGIEQERKDDGSFPMKNVSGASNWINARASVTISIRDMYEIVLPLLNNHPHLQKAHFALRGEGDDKYEPYCYNAAIIHFTDPHTRNRMVSFRRMGSSNWETVSLELFNDIKDGLKLSFSKKDLENLTVKK